jgi:TldD protein
MTDHYSRRGVVKLGALGLAAVSVGDLLGCATVPSAGPSLAGGDRIRYFSRFGIDEALIRETLAAALGSGGDRADVFFQHRVMNSLSLEDGAVNRANATVQLGAGVRVVKGDQQGYAFTEDLTPASLKRAAQTAAAVASGPARPAPISFRSDPLPSRYVLKTPWESVRVEQKLPLLNGLNAAAFAADARVKKVNVAFSDEAGAVLIADSSGRLSEDVQPMSRVFLSVVAEQNGRRESNLYNLAGRAGLELLDADRVNRHGERGRRPHDVPLRRRQTPRRGDARGARRRGLGHLAPRGHRARHGGRLQPQGRVDLRLADERAHRAVLRHRRRRRHLARLPRRDQHRR